MTLAQSKKITRQELLRLGFVENCYTPNILEYKGRDGAHEYIQAMFNDGTENQTVPNEINVVGLNNDVTICENEDMTYEILRDAILLVFAREMTRGGQEEMAELTANLNNANYLVLVNTDYLHRRFMEKACEYLDRYMANEVCAGNHSRMYADSFMEKFKKAVTNEF